MCKIFKNIAGLFILNNFILAMQYNNPYIFNIQYVKLYYFQKSQP